jgi:hypothetical protein
MRGIYYVNTIVPKALLFLEEDKPGLTGYITDSGT